MLPIVRGHWSTTKDKDTANISRTEYSLSVHNPDYAKEYQLFTFVKKAMSFEVAYYGGGGRFIECDKFPNKCPYCHHAIQPRQVACVVDDNGAQVFMLCPYDRCHSTFIAYYRKYPAWEKYIFTDVVSKGSIVKQNFSEIIIQKSPSFALIYNEASAAEQHGLNQICGVGFRKALEFLIKDYCIINHPEKKETIEKSMLGKVIDQFIEDDKIKSVAKRATWLGNDETHYIRKWEGKDLTHLKTLINLTINWMENEAMTKQFELDMPEN